MNWKDLLIGISSIIAAFIFYKVRKSGYIESDEYATINKLKGFNAWLGIIMFAILGIAFIIKSF